MLLATGLLAAVWSSRAEPVSQLHPTNYVNDFAHVLDAATVDELNAVCQQVDTEAHAQIAVVTIHSLDGEQIEDYAVDLFKQWGVGNKASDRGVLVLLVVGDRRYRIEVGYGLEPILPDARVGDFGRQAVPRLRQGDYNGALSLMTWGVAELIAQDAKVQLSRPVARAPSGASQGTGPGFSIGAVLVVLALALLVLLTPLRGLLFWFLLSGGGGGWGGGGFGGGGGGGFGGFGGGSSGGGGASGSW